MPEGLDLKTQLFVTLAALALAAGCAKNDRGGGSDVPPGERDVRGSRELNAKGASKDVAADEALDLFERAVRADPFNGAARNNLGVALMARGDYYAAANEFEQAIRLLPANPQARVNLGLLYETVGQLERAREQFEKALIVSPEYMAAVQPLARVRVRSGLLDEQTVELLRLIVLRTVEPAWRSWAQKHLASASVLQSAPATRPVNEERTLERPPAEPSKRP